VHVLYQLNWRRMRTRALRDLDAAKCLFLIAFLTDGVSYIQLLNFWIFSYTRKVQKLRILNVYVVQIILMKSNTLIQINFPEHF